MMTFDKFKMMMCLIAVCSIQLVSHVFSPLLLFDVLEAGADFLLGVEIVARAGDG